MCRDLWQECLRYHGIRSFCFARYSVSPSSQPGCPAGRDFDGQSWTMNHLQTTWDFLRSKSRHVVTYATSQGITIAGNLLYGLLCVRMLPITDYAHFAVLFSFLGTLTVLLDIGISSTLAPLIAERIDDLQLIADYVASLRQLAHWLYAIVAPGVILFFPLIIAHQHWPPKVVYSIIGIVLVAAWFARIGSAYGAVLILRRDRKSWYRAQMISSVGTLALLLILWPLHLVNAWTAILLNVAGIIYISQANYLRAQHLLGTKGHSSRPKRKAILRLITPSAPNVIFYALHGQVSLLLISLFGYTSGIASVGALSRLGQIFVIFSQMNPILIEPYFARLPESSLRRNYVLALSILVLVGAVVCSAAWLDPEIFLWVLGPKYSNLRVEVLILLASNSIRYVSGSLWVIHTARRFVYWWNNIGIIVMMLAVQIVCLFFYNLSTVHNVLLCSLWTAVGELSIALLCGIWGFTFGPRRIEST